MFIRDIPVEIVVDAEASERKGLVPIEVSIPIGSLTFDESAGELHAEVELTFVAIDPNGDKSSPYVTRAPITLPANALAIAKELPWKYTARLRTNSGEHRYVVTVRDLSSNKLGSAGVTASVP